jgi:hypothetical protein
VADVVLSAIGEIAGWPIDAMWERLAWRARAHMGVMRVALYALAGFLVVLAYLVALGGAFLLLWGIVQIVT